MPSIDALADRLSTYLGPDQVNLVRRAYFYAEQAHDGQRRRSGEAYVTQMAAYRAVLSQRWPNRPIRCLLVWTDGPVLMEIPPADLDRALANVQT